MKSVSFDACFCSTQKRARQTCEIIFKGTIVFDKRLSEINCGEFEGTEENAETMKPFWQAVTSGDRGTDVLQASPRNIISVNQLPKMAK